MVIMCLENQTPVQCHTGIDRHEIQTK